MLIPNARYASEYETFSRSRQSRLWAGKYRRAIVGGGGTFGLSGTSLQLNRKATQASKHFLASSTAAAFLFVTAKQQRDERGPRLARTYPFSSTTVLKARKPRDPLSDHFGIEMQGSPRRVRAESVFCAESVVDSARTSPRGLMFRMY